VLGTIIFWHIFMFIPKCLFIMHLIYVVVLIKINVARIFFERSWRTVNVRFN